MKQVVYTQTGSAGTNLLTKNRGFVRCNHWHKIHLTNIELTNNGERLTAITRGKKCNCGFHCQPLNS